MLLCLFFFFAPCEIRRVLNASQKWVLMRTGTDGGKRSGLAAGGLSRFAFARTGLLDGFLPWPWCHSKNPPSSAGRARSQASQDLVGSKIIQIHHLDASPRVKNELRIATCKRIGVNEFSVWF